jgi:hypothetical protein
MTHPSNVLSGRSSTGREPDTGVAVNDLPSPGPATLWLDRHIAGRRLRVVAVDETHVEAHVLNADGTKARTTRILRRAWSRRVDPVPAQVDTPDAGEDAARHALQTAAERQSVLAEGLAWLYTTVQPDGAIADHGPTLAAGARAYTFHPTGPTGAPVVVVTVQQPRYEQRDGDVALVNPLGDGETAEVAEALAELGVRVVDRPPGGHETASVSLAEPAHPTLLAAVRRCHDECPEHRTVLCGQRFGHAGHDCPWYRRGTALLVQPPRRFAAGPTTPATGHDPVAWGMDRRGEYIRSRYGVRAHVNVRVSVDYQGRRTGTIVGFDGAYLLVAFDGQETPWRLHPTWRVDYQNNPIWLNRGGPGISGCDPRPAAVDRFRDAAGEHWTPIEPGGMWFRCEETNRGARYWADVLTFGPLGEATTVDVAPPTGRTHGAPHPVPALFLEENHG